MTEPSLPARTAPLLTVVLPVWGVEEYLPACLDSIFGEALTEDLEVIAVDDASPDACGAILDERAAREPRLRVIHLTERAGPGPARTRGMAEATGDYLWFVDPDDTLVAGCFAHIGRRLTRDRPDVLLIDYLSLYPDGHTEPGHLPGLLAAPHAGPLTLAGRPALLNRTMTIWSKVISREFLAGLKMKFPPGIHEDVAISCALLLRARTISPLDRVCYRYRQRSGSFLATPSMAHFAIFDAYRQVFCLLRESSESAASPVAAAVFARAIEHCNSILASGLVPRQARRDFFRRMHADFQRHRPPGYHRPGGLRGLRVWMIERNAYRSYSLTASLNDVRVALRHPPASPRPGNEPAGRLPSGR